MNPKDSPQRKDSHFPAFSRPLIIVFIILAVSAYLFNMSNNTTPVEEATLPEIVSAIEAGKVETLTVQGNNLTAKIVDGTNLGARKESNISTVEALQIMGVSEEALRTLPIQVVDPGIGAGTLFSILLTFAPILFIGYIFFRMFRQMPGSGGGGGMFGIGRIGRSNPRVMGATRYGPKGTRPVWPAVSRLARARR